MAPRAETPASHPRVQVKPRSNLRSIIEKILSTRARTAGAAIAGTVGIVGTIFGIFNAGGASETPTSASSVTNNTTNNTYNGPSSAPQGSGPSGPPSNSDCAGRGNDKIGHGTSEVYITLTEKKSPNECWSEYLAPIIPGSTVRFLISYGDASHQIQRNVVVRIILPTGFELIPNTTRLYNTNHPKGIFDTQNDIAKGGVEIGSYYSGAWAYVTFSLAVPFGDGMSCGWNEIRPTVIIQPTKKSAFYNKSILEVAKKC